MANVHLHILDAASPAAHPTALAAVAARLARDRAAGLDVRLILCGGRALHEEALAVGLAEAGTPLVSAPAGQAWRNLPGLARALRSQVGPPAEKLHCWSINSLFACHLLRPRPARTLTLLHGPGPRSLRWLRRVMRLSRGSVVVETPWQTVAGRLLAGGIDPREVTMIAPLAPALPAAPLDAAALRARWQIDDCQWVPNHPSPRRAVIALLSEPPTAGDGSAATMAIGLARESLASRPSAEAAPEPLLLIHPRQHHAPRAKFNLAQLGRSHLLAQEPALDRPWTVLPGCDAALILGEAPTAIHAARQANVPIVAEDLPLNTELLAGDDSAQLVPAHTPKRAAYALELALYCQARPVA